MIDDNDKQRKNSLRINTSSNNIENSIHSDAPSSHVNYEEVLNTAAALALHSSKGSHNTSNNKSRLLNPEGTGTGSNTTHHNGTSSSSSPSLSSPRSATTPSSPNRNFSWIKQNILLSASAEDAAMLSSLPKRPIANFPDEADRKRIIGCLAAILSMMFDHELQGFLNYKSLSKELNNSGNSYNNSENNKDNEKSRIQVETINGSMTVGDSNLRESVVLMDDSSSIDEPIIEYDDFESVDENPKILNQSGDSAGSLNSSKSSSSRWGRKSKIPNATTTSSSTTTGASNNNKIPPKKSTSNNTLYYRPSALVEQQIYRRRRHEVYSSFLVFSAELLLLDKSNAVAFLPLLNSMLGENKPIFNSVEAGGRKTTIIKVNGSRNTPSVTSTDNSIKVTSSSASEDSSQDNGLLRGWNRNEDRNCDVSLSQQNSSLDTSQNNYDHDHLVEFETTMGIQEDDKPKQTWDNNELLTPFIESLSPGAGFQCLALLLTNYLLRSQVGYDARVRHIMKKLGLVLICHEMNISGEYKDKNDDYLARLATRKFEALEDAVALKLLRLSSVQEHKAAVNNDKLQIQDDTTKKAKTMQKIVRGLKVGSAGIAAGTLFAVTGGLAAPGIAAGLAASGITFTAATASIVTTLTSTAAVTTIFGIGGGSLAAYKTHRRVKGITEFVLTKEVRKTASINEKKILDGNLFSIICVSGWLTDDRDFQRPWGVEPSNPPITDWAEKLNRFYTIYNPEVIPRINEILKRWKGEERNLWIVLRQKYGRDPDQLYPLQNSCQRSTISYLESEIIDNLLTELGYVVNEEESLEIQKSNDRFGMFKSKNSGTKKFNYDDTLSTAPNTPAMSTSRKFSNNDVSAGETINEYIINNNGEEESKDQSSKPIHDIWDYKSEYGGELLTLRWESDLLIELCDSVTDMAVDMVGTAAKEILKQTALSTLITAIAWPYGLVKAANMIDGTWTLAIERADLAGIELARRLLESKAGHRPVVLVGFSMGARAVYSCLKELARHQLLWEERRKTLKKDRNFMEEREPASIIEDAIMLGLPNHLSVHSWMSCRSVVAGRLVNCYSGKDLILSLMFQIKRLSGALKPVCGTNPVNVPGVENYDVSNFISAHSDYCKKTGHILRMIYHGCPYRPSVTITIPREFIPNPVV